MNRSWLKSLFFVGILVPWIASAQQTCINGIRVEGTITDPTGAVIPGAQVQAASGEKATSDPTGHYVLPCIPAISTAITAQAEGFATGTARATGRLGGTVRANLQLPIASVQTDVQVNADATGIDSDQSADTTLLGTNQVQQLPDDPDDLLQELQILASNGGGSPESTTFVVNGFQNPTAMPPKSSIASIPTPIPIETLPDMRDLLSRAVVWRSPRSPARTSFTERSFSPTATGFPMQPIHSPLRQRQRVNGAMVLN